MSANGVRLVGNYLATTGTMVQLMPYVPDNLKPLYVTRAGVRWVRGIEMGIELLTLPGENRARLDAFWSDPFSGDPPWLSLKQLSTDR